MAATAAAATQTFHDPDTGLRVVLPSRWTVADERDAGTLATYYRASKSESGRLIYTGCTIGAVSARPPASTEPEIARELDRAAREAIGKHGVTKASTRTVAGTRALVLVNANTIDAYGMEVALKRQLVLLWRRGSKVTLDCFATTPDFAKAQDMFDAIAASMAFDR